MKKLVLPLMLFIGYSSLNAQCAWNGYAPTGVYDDFTSATDPNNPNFSGAYTWGEATLGGDANPEFKAVVTRSGGKLNATVTQGAGKYAPFGISFGDSNGDQTGTLFYLDLSGDKTFSADFTNNSDSTIKFRMTIQDATGKEIDTYADYATTGGGAFGEAYKYVIEQTANAHSTVSFGSGNAFANTYAGGAKADYANSAFVTGFDFTKVKGVYFTLSNSGNGGAGNGYMHNGFTDLSFTIDNVKVGACPVGINTLSSNESANVYPNPTSTLTTVTLNLNQNANVNISIVDMFGRTVKEVANGVLSSVNQTVNVSDLSQGVYTVSYVVDGAVAKSSLLMVK